MWLSTSSLLLFFLDRCGGVAGIDSGSNWKTFKELFYFSTQTFTTVGYGRINPIGDAANTVSSIEALTGFLSLAIATGFTIWSFFKTEKLLAFSDHALISRSRMEQVSCSVSQRSKTNIL